MKNFTSYLQDAYINKLYEFRVKIAAHEVTTDLKGKIERALEAFQVECVSAPKRLPIQEHVDFPNLGACECYVIEVAVKYPTISDQVRQFIFERASIPLHCIVVRSLKEEASLADVQEQDGPILNNPELGGPSGQDSVGDKRVGSLLKELETHKYDIAGDDTTVGGDKQASYGKTSNDLPQGTSSPVGSNQNKIPSPVKGQK